MTHRNSAGRFARDDGGAVIVMVALGMIVLLSCVAIGIDIGKLMTARTESQRVADAAALAGAGSLILQPNDADAARSLAQYWTTQNDVRGMAVSTLSSDIDVDLQARTVEVWVHNSAARGNPVPTTFARVFGWNHVDVVTMAKAEASMVAGSANCLLPLALPDRWIDDGDGAWDPSDDVYAPWPDQNHTGYGEDDIGLQVQIKTQPASGTPQPGCQTASSFDPCSSHPGWDCWWLDAHPSQGGGGGVSALGPRIFPGCDDPDAYSSLGDDIWAASGAGNKQSLVQNEFKDLVDSDPGISWDDVQNCPARNGECTSTSPRIRAMPMVRPDQVSGGGASVYAPIQSFTGVFVEKVSCSPTMPHGGGPSGRWNVYVRLMGGVGWNPGSQSGPNPPLAKALRLVQ